jgi:hypothetical protein
VGHFWKDNPQVEETDNQISFGSLALRTIVTHTITYSLMGVLAMTFLNYAEQFSGPTMASWMRQTTDPIVMAGPLFQPIRGLVFALVFYPLRGILFGRKNGWLLMWWILVGLGILSTFGPTPGSLEGMVYTTIPIGSQLRGWIEVVPQALLLSVILCYWVRHPKTRWLNWALPAVFVVLLLLVVLGLVVTNSAKP